MSSQALQPFRDGVAPPKLGSRLLRVAVALLRVAVALPRVIAEVLQVLLPLLSSASKHRIERKASQCKGI